MHCWLLHEEKEGNIFMNINEQTVSCNIKVAEVNENTNLGYS